MDESRERGVSDLSLYGNFLQIYGQAAAIDPQSIYAALQFGVSLGLPGMDIIAREYENVYREWLMAQRAKYEKKQ